MYQAMSLLKWSPGEIKYSVMVSSPAKEGKIEII